MANDKGTKELGTVDTIITECVQCGMSFERPKVRGNPPKRCLLCRPKSRTSRKTSGVDTNTTGYRLSLVVTNYRLAIEEATSALLLGKNEEALAALRRVQAPKR